jgi:membrane protease YdiL (CAAX protease family)
LAEEFYFRGLLFEHLRRGMAAWRAVVLCSLLFGLLHLPSDAVFTAIALSLAACGLVLLTGGLEFAIALHAAWNAFTVIALLDNPAVRWTWAAAASVAAIAIIIACRTAAGTFKRP